MKSLEKQLTFGMSAVLLGVFAMLLLVSVNAVKSLTETHVQTRLEHDAEALLGALWINPRGRLRLREGRITPIYQQPLSGHYYLFEFKDGYRIFSRSLWDDNINSEPMNTGKVKLYKTDGPAQQKLLMRSAGYEKLGLQFTLTVAEDLTPLHENMRVFQISALLLLIVAGLFIILLQRFLLRRGFRPVDAVRDEVQKISTGEIRSIKTQGPTEIQPLSHAINRLLVQLSQRLKRSRESLGNLAHALKTPLTLLTHEIDSLPVDPPEKKQLNDKLQRISTLIDRELKRARFAGENIGKSFNANKDIPELIDALLQIHQQRDLQVITNSLPDTALPFDHEDMLELLGNLLDNAFKHARNKINLKMDTKEFLAIEIHDDGPGVSEAELENMIKRGNRLDEQENGHGLGLAIVNNLVNDYGGSLEFKNSTDTSGLSVSVRLPFPSTDF